jgi:excisionase family DNA binding protein
MEDHVKALTMDVASAARALGLGRNLMYELVLSGRVRSLKIGRRRLIPVSALEEFLESELALQGGTADESGNGVRGRTPRPAGGGQKQRPRN